MTTLQIEYIFQDETDNYFENMIIHMIVIEREKKENIFKKNIYQSEI